MAESFIVKIDSIGGYVDAGMDIYNYLKNLSVPVTTYTTKAYSIASVIFMAGESRVIPEGATEALMIHLPWMQAEGNHQQLTDYLKELKATEDDLVDFYSKAIGIDKTTIHSLLSSETFLNANQCIDLGFATQLQTVQKAVARLQNNKEENEDNFMNKISRKLDSIMNMLTGKVKAELVLQDATGVSLVFPDLADGDTVSVDDKVTTVDSKPADGDYLLPDGSTLTAVKGVVTAVTPAPEAVPADDTLPTAEAMNETLNPDGSETETPEEEKTEDGLVAELQTKVGELQSIIDEMMSADQAAAMLETLTETKENKTTVKASGEFTSRAQRILNS